MIPLVLFLLLLRALVPVVASCVNNQCGDFQLPFPFHLNNTTSCGVGLQPYYHAFLLSCHNSTILSLNIGSESYRVLEFFSDSVLVDILPSGMKTRAAATSSCRPYLDMNSFIGLDGNAYYGISTQNVLCLYDCQDSSVCKLDCDKLTCQPNVNNASTCTCCNPLSDPSAWEIGDGISVFGCRGFSSWFVPTLGGAPKLGIKLEWAIPRDSSSKQICAPNALAVNATTVKAGVRCTCRNGFLGDGFVDGLGCFKSCAKDERQGCHVKTHSKKEVVILAGILVSVSILASLGVVCTLVRRRPNTHPRLEQRSVSFHRANNRTRLFTYRELEEATQGFDDEQKLADSIQGKIHSGVLADGTHVAVQKVRCENEHNLVLFLSQVEILSHISHKNVARVLGCCIDSGYTPLVIYEFSSNGTLETYLLQEEYEKSGLDWYRRLTIAAETASALAYLQYEIVPPIYHHHLNSASIFLDQDFSVKIAGFELLNSDASHFRRSHVYDLGVILLEIVAGPRHVDLPTIALPKIRSGKLEEIVDPRLYYHEQPTFCREQIEIIADLSTRCLLFGGDGRLGMMDVARELGQMMKESPDSSSKRVPALEETFSNSSLLQMISMSPDSIYAL